MFRHLSLVLWYVLGGAPGWSHAGSWSLSRSDSFSALTPRVGGAQEVNRLLIEVTKAQAGLELDRSMNALIQTTFCYRSLEACEAYWGGFSSIPYELRNCVMPPIIIWIISRFPSREG